MYNTVFDKVVSGEIPADIVYENEDVIAFRDISPKAPVHVLVIPKQRLSRFSELSAWEPVSVGKFFTAVSVVAGILGLEKDGYRVVVNNGRDGGQEVEYLHAHILGGRRLTWPPG
jgi:histidine triad (HIT) family protein